MPPHTEIIDLYALYKSLLPYRVYFCDNMSIPTVYYVKFVPTGMMTDNRTHYKLHTLEPADDINKIYNDVLVLNMLNISFYRYDKYKLNLPNTLRMFMMKMPARAIFEQTESIIRSMYRTEICHDSHTLVDRISALERSNDSVNRYNILVLLDMLVRLNDRPVRW